MCGILGFSGKQTDKLFGLELLRNMGLLQYHRGPDEWGEFYEKSVFFGHNRLSVIDKAGGTQPMISLDGKFVLVFNGEIYNYKELRAELTGKGIHFFTNSDTEVILNGIANIGMEYVKKLDGMFAFALYNRIENTVTICRDRLGIKPLYFIRNNRNFVFASEIKPLIYWKKNNNESLEIRIDSVKNYFHFRSGSYGNTLIEGIESLEPGSYLINCISENITKIESFYSPVVNLLNQENLVSRLDEIVQKSVYDHLISDVPVGVFLSGGVDSSLISHFVNQKQSFLNLTIGVNEDDFDESKYASRAAKINGSKLIVKKISSQDFLREYSYWSFINDDPVSDPSALALMILSRFAKENGLKVMLAGEGADELFGGYNSYLKYFIYNKFKKNPLTKGALCNALHRKYPKLLDYQIVDGFLGTSHLTSFIEKANLFKGDILITPENYIVNYDGLENVHSYRLMLLADQKYRLPSDVLARTDRATMAYSIEARVPFLSNELISFANCLNYSDCINVINGKGKILLKEVAMKYYPKSFINRKKIGFDLPISKWLIEDFRDLITIKLNEKNLDFLNYRYLEEVYLEKSNVALIWAWLQLENWYDNIFNLNVETKHPLLNNPSGISNYFNNQTK
jgi:asparagine synthase (glutamine-hydrolysing)